MAAHDHLLVYREVVLRTPADRRRNVLRFEILIDLGQNLLEIHVALPGPAGYEHDDFVVDLRIEDLEAQFLQLGFDGIHAQPVRQRRIDVKRFASLLLCARRLDIAPGAGVVDPIGQLDHEHAHIAAHGYDHLANRLSLRRIAVVHLRQLGDAVDQTGDRVAEFGAAFIQAVVGILDRIVQQACGHDDGTHAQVRENLGNRQRVNDVRLA